MKSSPLRFVAFGLAWAVTLVAAYFIGSSGESADATASADQANTVAKPFNAEKDDSTFSRGGDELALAEATDAEQAAPGHSGGMRSFNQVLDMYLENPSSVSAQQHLRMMIQGLSPEEIAPVLAKIESLAPGQARDEMIVALVGTWAAYDPAAALAYAQEIPMMRLSSRAVNEALEGWGKADPASALAWWSSPENFASGRVRNLRLESILEGYAATDAIGAFQYASMLPDDSLGPYRGWIAQFYRLFYGRKKTL